MGAVQAIPASLQDRQATETEGSMIKPLTRVNVTHRKPTDPGVLWLISCGYRFKVGRQVWLVMPTNEQAARVRQGQE